MKSHSNTKIVAYSEINPHKRIKISEYSSWREACGRDDIREEDCKKQCLLGSMVGIVFEEVDLTHGETK